VRVDENLERMRTVLDTGDETVALRAVCADDDIDAMSVSLTERCYELLVREGPVASDLRFVVSVLRVLGDFERIGDLALRVVNLWPDHDLMRSRPATYGLLLDLADAAIERYRDSMRAWATMSVELATEVTETPSTAGLYEERLLGLLLALEGTDAARVAVRTLVAGKSLERIADHAGIIAVRLLYLLTGDAGHLTREVR
jgi:phosphate transport system protein